VEAARDHRWMVSGFLAMQSPLVSTCGLSGFGLCVVSSGLCMQSPPVSTSLSGLCMQSPPVSTSLHQSQWSMHAVSTNAVSTSLSGLCSFCCEHRPKPPRLQRPLETGKKLHKQVETVMTRETTGDCKCDWCLQHHTRRNLHTICTFPWRSQPCAEEMVTRKRSGASDA